VEAPTLRAASGRGRNETRLSKADQIHGALKLEITFGELLPGTAIDKTELCRRFSVSRLPVTTALQRLAFEGLVLIEPQRGSYVSRIRFDDVLQWMIARRAIEAEVAAEAARRLPAGAREELERNLRYQEAAVAGTDFDGFIRLDVAFHHLLTDGLELNRIAETLDALRVHLDRVRRLLLPEAGRMAATLAEHRTIGEAIASSKPSAAGRAMRRHLAVVMDRLTAFEREHPDFFGS
jgi:GntR family transcriptional regulator, rspAB operon transcriptional repressor